MVLRSVTNYDGEYGTIEGIEVDMLVISLNNSKYLVPVSLAADLQDEGTRPSAVAYRIANERPKSSTAFAIDVRDYAVLERLVEVEDKLMKEREE